jgi:LytS/YehU family sensor histidine kinase
VTFIQKLSKIYRYVLEVQKEELVTLAEELRFLESYVGLQKIRFGENFQVEIEITNRAYLIPPLSLQLLIENAIKHNEISSKAPLKISIKQIEDSLLIENNLQKKDINEKSTGVGLKNIESRLAFFTERQLAVVQKENMFQVELPILKST